MIGLEMSENLRCPEPVGESKIVSGHSGLREKIELNRNDERLRPGLNRVWSFGLSGRFVTRVNSRKQPCISLNPLALLLALLHFLVEALAVIAL